LIIAFEPVQNLTLKIFGTNSEAHEWEHKLEDERLENPATVNYAALEKQIFERHPYKKEIQLYSFNLSDSSSYYVMNVAKSIGLKSAEDAERIYVDRQTGEEIATPGFVSAHNTVENTW